MDLGVILVAIAISVVIYDFYVFIKYEVKTKRSSKKPLDMR